MLPGVHAVRGGIGGSRVIAVDPGAEAEEVVDGAREAERAGGRVVAVGVPGLFQQPLEHRVVEIRDGDHEPPEPVVDVAADAHRQPALLHLPRLLLLLLPLHDDV